MHICTIFCGANQGCRYFVHLLSNAQNFPQKHKIPLLDAQFVVANFLKHRKWKQVSIDVAQDLHNYLSNTSNPDQPELEAKFKNIVPRKTPAFLEKERKAKLKAENAEKKRQEKAAKAKADKERKQDMINALKAQQETRKKEAAAAVLLSGFATAGSGPPVDPTGDTAATGATAATGSNGANGATGATGTAGPKTTGEETPLEVDLPDSDDVFFEYKMKISTFEIETPARRETKRAKHVATQAAVGIQKTILCLTEKGVKVVYTKPGQVWVQGMMSRIENLVGAMNVFSTGNPEMVKDCIVGERNQINDDCGRVVLAAMLHLSAKNDKELPDIGVHANFFEKNFIADLKNMKAHWLPIFTKEASFNSLLFTIWCAMTKSTMT
jgi:hypothetical protein